MQPYLGQDIGALKQGHVGSIADYARAQHGNMLGNLARANPVPEVGIIERASGIANGLQSLHDKIGSIRDKIEGIGQASGKNSAPTPHGLRSQLSEAESVLRACHSLLDDIAGKF